MHLAARLGLLLVLFLLVGCELVPGRTYDPCGAGPSHPDYADVCHPPLR